MLLRGFHLGIAVNLQKQALFINTARMPFLSKICPVSSLGYDIFCFISHQKTLFV